MWHNFKTLKNSGAALLTVLVAMLVISIMLFEFQYSSMVERQLAFSELNQLQAYYLAKSGIRIGLLRVALYGRARKDPSVSKATGGLDVKPYLEMIWRLPLPAFPPKAELLGKLARTDKDSAEKILEQTRVTDGQVTHIITSESAKLNLNFLVAPSKLRNARPNFTASGQKSLFEYVGLTLIQILDNFWRDSESPYEEYGNLKPEEVVYDIMDWINPGEERFLGGSKDSFYEQQRPPYKAKRHRFYTVDELKLVRGIDDHLFTKLRPYVTVYSEDGRININTAGTAVIAALYRDFTPDDVKRILEERDKRGGFLNEQQFVEYVSSTLGRSGFKTFYDRPNEYPFTVSSQSFLIESLGMIRKSASQVQKMIRVAVVLTRGKGGTVNTSVTNSGECNSKPGFFWDTLDNKCRSKPTNTKECEFLGGQWEEDGNRKTCKILTRGNIELKPQDTTSGVQEANALKILHWSES